MKEAIEVRDLPLISDQHEVAERRLDGLVSTDRAAREEILHRAYAIWASEGYPEGRKLANWLQAEAEFRQDA